MDGANGWSVVNKKMVSIRPSIEHRDQTQANERMNRWRDKLMKPTKQQEILGGW